VSLLLYNLLLPLAVLAMLPGALRKMRARGGRSQDLWQRLGLLNTAQRQALAHLTHFDHRLWVHAVSVGEMNVALKFLAPLLKASPSTAVFLTTTTPPGHQIASHFAAQYPHRVAVFYSPIDFPPIVSHLLDQVAPHRLILVEAEVWPNLVAAAQRRHIPITLAAARLSPRSEKRFAQFSWFTRPLFARLSQVLVPEPEDIQRWTQLGVDPRRIHLTGSVKYDPSSTSVSPTQLAQFTQLLLAAGLSPTEHPILLAASTHAGEELALAQLHQQLRQSPSPRAAHLARLILDVWAGTVTDFPYDAENFPRNQLLSEPVAVEVAASISWSALGLAVWRSGRHTPSKGIRELMELGPHLIASHQEAMLDLVRRSRPGDAAPRSAAREQADSGPILKLVSSD
jgi:3-deoxy-D-manno-octulosonic-acid transferase